MLASIENKSAGSWIKAPISLAVNPSLKAVAAAIGWGLAIGVCVMLAQTIAVLGSLYATGIVDL
ncbi:MAG: hypothetical protein ACKVOI_06365 [Dongiaceae bacterium]